MAIYLISKIIKQIRSDKINPELFKGLNVHFNDIKNLDHIFTPNDYPKGENLTSLLKQELTPDETKTFFLHIFSNLNKEEQKQIVNFMFIDFNSLFEPEDDNNIFLNYVFENELLTMPFTHGRKINTSVNPKNKQLTDPDYVKELLNTLYDMSNSINSDTMIALQEVIKKHHPQLKPYFDTILESIFESDVENIRYSLYTLFLDLDINITLEKKKELILNLLKTNIDFDLNVVKADFDKTEIFNYLLKKSKTENERKLLLTYDWSYSQTFQLIKNQSSSYKENSKHNLFSLEMIKNSLLSNNEKNQLILSYFIKTYSITQNEVYQFLNNFDFKYREQLILLTEYAFNSSNHNGYAILNYFLKNNIKPEIPNNAIPAKLKYYFNGLKEELKDDDVFSRFDPVQVFNVDFENTEEDKALFLKLLPLVVKQIVFKDFSAFKSHKITDNELTIKLEALSSELSSVTFSPNLNIVEKIANCVFYKGFEEAKSQPYFIDFSKKVINSIFYDDYHLLANQFVVSLLRKSWNDNDYQFLQSIELEPKQKMILTNNQVLFIKNISEYLSKEDFYSFKRDKDEMNHYISLSKQHSDVALCDELLTIIEKVKSGDFNIDKAMSFIQQKKLTILGQNNG